MKLLLFNVAIVLNYNFFSYRMDHYPNKVPKRPNSKTDRVLPELFNRQSV